MKLGISPTLLNSFDWYNNCPSTWKEKAKEDIIKTLKRLPKDYGLAVARGNEFEAAVQKVCEHQYDRPITEWPGSDNFKKVVKKCIGGVFQTWCEFYFMHDDKRVRAYGKIDVTLPDCIIDIKTTGRYKGAQNYLTGWQPDVYLLATRKPMFEFVVAEWAGNGSSREHSKIKNVYEIQYAAHPEMEKKLVAQYDRFVVWLRDNDLYDDYVYTFCKNPRT